MNNYNKVHQINQNIYLIAKLNIHMNLPTKIHIYI